VVNLSGTFRKMVVEKTSRYRTGLFILVLGLLSLSGSLILAYLDFTGTWTGGTWKSDIISVLTEPRDDQPISLGVGLRLVHYLIAGLALTFLGGGLTLSAMRIMPLIEEVTITLMCTSCKNRWNESIARTSLESMGYPRVKSLSRRRCSKCGRFIRPRIVAVEGELTREAQKAS